MRPVEHADAADDLRPSLGGKARGSTVDCGEADMSTLRLKRTGLVALGLLVAELAFAQTAPHVSVCGSARVTASS